MDQGVNGETFMRYPYFSYSFLFLFCLYFYLSAQLSRQRLNGMGYDVPLYMAVADTTKWGNEERYRNHCFALTGYCLGYGTVLVDELKIPVGNKVSCFFVSCHCSLQS